MRFATLLAVMLLATLSAVAQDAKALRAQASAESNQEKVVQLLCKAADLDRQNKDYRKDCDNSRTALISSDKTMLKTAQDASDAGKIVTARRYAKYVSSLDPELHRQAEQLLAKLNASDTSTATSVTTLSGGGAATPPQPPGPVQSVVLAQALAAYDNGNLQAARAGAQSITDASLKPAAARVLTEIERYTGLVSAGQRHESAKEYAEAEKSFQSAVELNGHVASDDLTGRMQRMRQMASAQQQQMVAKGNVPPKPQPADLTKVPRGSEITPEEKKRRLFEDVSVAMARNDLDLAARKYKQILDLDPANADAKRGLTQISDALNRDPVRLETTLREAIVAFYSSRFDDAESRFNRYLGADKAKKKGAAYFYLGATEATLAMLEDDAHRGARSREARENFKQARLAGYVPVERYVSARVLGVWNNTGL